jgi:hypothetical protein
MQCSSEHSLHTEINGNCPRIPFTDDIKKWSEDLLRPHIEQLNMVNQQQVENDQPTGYQTVHEDCQS